MTQEITDLPQPFGFYRVLTGNDYLHFSYWSKDNTQLSLSQAQKALSQLLLERFPKPPKRILDVGCGLGAMAGQLADSGFSVVAIAPSYALINYAKHYHPGPEYIACGFLDDHPRLLSPECYDLILFQESLQYFPQLAPVFKKVKELLEPSQGRMVFCDEVSYTPQTKQHSAVHEAKNIERHFAEQGFFVRYHKRIGPEVTPTCEKALKYFKEKRSELLELFGPESNSEIDHFIQGWTQQQTYYQTGQFGYEVWDIRPSNFPIKTYQTGDETAIINGFKTAFGVSRSQEHWSWKFQHSPFGGPYISTVWDESEIVAHYTAYPVPLWLENCNIMTYQLADTFTLPAYRGIGRGQTSLLGRVCRHFYRLYCEGEIPFFYGFNTNKIQRFGKLFLGYYPVTPVYDWVMTDEILRKFEERTVWYNYLHYTVSCVENVGDWADSIFTQAKQHYGSLVARNQQYLQWRYQEHPDFRYHFFVVRRWGKAVGWWLVRLENETLIIGDALFSQKTVQAPQAGLRAMLHFFKQQKSVKIQKIQGWFSRTPAWWNDVLEELGFKPQRQSQNLDFGITSFNDDFDPEQFGKNFYFTQGDSDLF